MVWKFFRRPLRAPPGRAGAARGEAAGVAPLGEGVAPPPPAADADPEPAADPGPAAVPAPADPGAPVSGVPLPGEDF